MQSDMNIPNKFLSFEEDAFCKFYTSHANDKSSELREKISKNLSVLTNNNINDLEFTDAGDIKLRERDITPVKDQGDQSTRFQKNAKDIEKFIKFIGDFKGIINKEDAVIIKNQLMTNVSNPFLDPSVKTPLMNAWNAINEEIISAPKTEFTKAEVSDLKSELQGAQFKKLFNDYSSKLEAKITENKELLKTQKELESKTESEASRDSIITAVVIPTIGVLGSAIAIPVLAVFGVPLLTAALVAIPIILIAVGLLTPIIAIINGVSESKLDEIKDGNKVTEASSREMKSSLRRNAIIAEQMDKESDFFKGFYDQYEEFSLEEIFKDDSNAEKFLELFYSINVTYPILTNEKIKQYEKELGLKRRAV